jgi:4-carboxymuconolactone decarboxylase
MNQPSEPPSQHQAFVTRYPKLGEAWDCIHAAEADGPLDARTVRLVKLAVAIGALKEGAVHAAARKALAAGVAPAELEQVVALAAATVGLPSAVAAFSWVQDVLGKE